MAPRGCRCVRGADLDMEARTQNFALKEATCSRMGHGDTEALPKLCFSKLVISPAATLRSLEQRLCIGSSTSLYDAYFILLLARTVIYNYRLTVIGMCENKSH